MIKVKNDWWKDFFNEIYLITDARSICDPHLTRREVDLLERILNLEKNDSIIDICGGHGRHCLELARRGYRNLTVLDFSKYLIRMGRKAARQAGLDVKFIRKDARFSGLKNGYYSAVFIFANSFGYFQDEKENIKVLKESHRILRQGGRILLDIADAEQVKNNLKHISWHEADKDVIVFRKRERKNEIIRVREIVISKTTGLLRDGCYSERLYDKNRITRLLKTSAFKNISVVNNISLHKAKNDYGLLTSRMFVKATKS